MFKVGDLIEGTERGNAKYSSTNESMLKAEVIEVYEDEGLIEIIIVDHLNADNNGDIHEVEPHYFDLVSSGGTGSKTTVPVGMSIPKPKSSYETLVVLGLL